MSKVDIAREFLTCALQRLEMEALESADHYHVKQVNKAILSVNMAIDDLNDTDPVVEDIEVTEGIEITHVAPFDPFAMYRKL